MSAEDTNIEKQRRRHLPSLIGIGAAVGFVAVAFLIFLSFATDPDDSPFDEGGAAAVAAD